MIESQTKINGVVNPEQYNLPVTEQELPRNNDNPPKPNENVSKRSMCELEFYEGADKKRRCRCGDDLVKRTTDDERLAQDDSDSKAACSQPQSISMPPQPVDDPRLSMSSLMDQTMIIPPEGIRQSGPRTSGSAFRLDSNVSQGPSALRLPNDIESLTINLPPLTKPSNKPVQFWRPFDYPVSDHNNDCPDPSSSISTLLQSTPISSDYPQPNMANAGCLQPNLTNSAYSQHLSSCIGSNIIENNISGEVNMIGGGDKVADVGFSDSRRMVSRHSEDIVDVPLSSRSIADMYSITQAREPFTSRRFNITENVYAVRFHEDQIITENLVEISDRVHAIFERILGDFYSSVNAEPNDYSRVTINHPSLDTPIHVDFAQVQNLTATEITNAISEVSQSQRDVCLDGEFTMEIFHVKIPSGSGHNRNLARAYLDDVDLEVTLKKSCITVRNLDNMCMARCIAIGLCYLDSATSKPERRKISKKPNFRVDGRLGENHYQRIKAEELHTQAGVPTDISCGPDAWNAFQDILAPHGISLRVYSKAENKRCIYRGVDNCIHILPLYLYNDHYAYVTSIKALKGSSYYCFDCDVCYNNRNQHSCVPHCRLCKNSPPCRQIVNRYCESCRRWFKNERCHDNHINSGMCAKLKACGFCGKLLDTESGIEHHCGQGKCTSCKSEVDLHSHICYMQSYDVEHMSLTAKRMARNSKNVNKDLSTIPQRYIFYDFETNQVSKYHEVNYVVAQIACSECITKPLDEYCLKCSKEDKREVIFEGSDALTNFMRWLLATKPVRNCKNKTNVLRFRDYIAIAHNSRGFDLHLVMSWLFKRTELKPDSVIMNGNKVVYLNVSDLHFKDSLAFLPFQLRQLPGIFNLPSEKGFFPYLLDSNTCFEYVGAYPAIDAYGVDCMSVSTRKEFDEWYVTVKDGIFNFRDAMKLYCRSDVDILRMACGKFREMFIRETGIPPFMSSMTLASLCNKVFRGNYLNDHKLVPPPVTGYSTLGNKKRYSIEACRWLDYLAFSKNVFIKHALTGGEPEVFNRSLDGYCPDTNEYFEYYGCAVHACPKCHPSKRMTTMSFFQPDLTLEEVYQKTLSRSSELRRMGLNIVEMWGCDFKAQRLNDPRIDAFLNPRTYHGPLIARSALYGGRTNAIRLHHQAAADEYIAYVDITSLYPYVCKTREYPLGVPEVIVRDFKQVEELESYFGLIKCICLPPKDLFFPVLPYRCNERLFFPLCSKCAHDLQSTECNHSDSERALHGVWTSVELIEAVHRGYCILEFIEIWHYKERTDTLFKGYIDNFLKIKQEASGYPEDAVTDVQKDAYVQEYFEHEGIRLDKSLIVQNKGLRTLAKQVLNSLWGYFALNPYPKHEYINSYDVMLKLLTNKQISVKDIRVCNDNVLLMSYKELDQFVPRDNRTNVVIAAFVTSHARVHLLQSLEAVGPSCIYHDTDSIVYVQKRGEPRLIPVYHDRLGYFTNEVPSHCKITDFVSTGPKSYAYKQVDTRTEEVKNVCKIKGLTLNYRNKRLGFDTMLATVKDHNLETFAQYPNTIIRTKDHSLLSKDTVKRFGFTYKKRIIFNDYYTKPYGFQGIPRI